MLYSYSSLNCAFAMPIGASDAGRPACAQQMPVLKSYQTSLVFPFRLSRPFKAPGKLYVSCVLQTESFPELCAHLPKAPSLAWEAEMEVTYDEYAMTE